jgi:hypothetical protein
MKYKTKIFTIGFGAFITIGFAKQLDCKNHYTDTIFGKTVEVCYASNYSDYTPQQAANEFLKDQVFVKGGRFNLNNNPKTFININSFYMCKYLVPYQEYNAYLKATNQWNEGRVGNKASKDRLSFETLNGLYPAAARYENAEGFCKWMGELTGLDVTLPNYQQWLYAATSKGTNWAYPTTNDKLEIGINYPDIAPKGSLTTSILVDKDPVNSLGIYQVFGNGWQWSSSTLSKKNAGYFNVSGTFGNKIAGGTHYPGAEMTPELIEKNTLISSFAVTPKPDDSTTMHFRCVINSDKPLPKSID